MFWHALAWPRMFSYILARSRMSSHKVLDPAGGNGADAELSGVGVGADLEVGEGHSVAAVIVDGVEPELVEGHSARLAVAGESLQNSVEAWSKSSHLQKESTSGLAVSMAPSLELLMALSSLSL